MRFSQTRASRAATLEKHTTLDDAFWETFDPVADRLPPNTSPHDYTNEFCAKLERKFWRDIGLGRAAWYGADSAGMLFTPETTVQPGELAVNAVETATRWWCGDAGSEQPISVLRNVEGDVCVACRGYGLAFDKLFALWHAQVLVCDAAREGECV